jgi:tetratricopeptide (TPR) repeat protein
MTLAAILTLSAFRQTPSAPDSVSAVSTLVRTGQYSAAVQASDEALRASPRDLRLFTLKAIALSKLGKSSEALAAFQSALNIDANYLPALAGAAELKYKEESKDAAVYLDRLLKVRPDDQLAHAMRAATAWRSGNCSLAVEHFAKADRQIASQPAALYEYGVCLLRLKRPETAASMFLQVRQLEPDNRKASYALELASIAYEEMGDTPNAVKTLREAIVLNPDRPELYVQFSSLSFEHKSYQVGIDMINAGLIRLPQSAELYIARGVLYAQMGEYQKADQDFSSAALLNPREGISSDAQILADIQASHLEKALKTVEERLKDHPADPFLHYLLAEILTKNGAQPQSPEFLRAVASAEKAVQLKPDFVLARDVLSRLYLESGQTAKAIAQCRATLKYDGNDQVALYRLIRALRAEDAKRHEAEISQLLQSLAEVRKQAQQKEVEASQYKLVEAPADTPSKKP